MIDIENNIFTPVRQEILAIQQITEIEWLFRLRFDNVAQVNYGQFVQVSLPKVGESPISITDFNVEEGWIEFLIRRVGKVTNEIFALEVGDTMFLRGPYGNGFPFDEQYKGKHLVIVAGGSGSGPVRSMINALQRNFDHVAKLDVILGFKDNNNILFRDEIANWRQKGNVILTVDEISEEEKDIYQGIVTTHVNKIDFSQSANMEVVIVGPPPMMHFTALEFVKHGVPEPQIWLSFERRMACAVGKCGHCKIDDVYVCLDGPVFNYHDGKKLLD